MSKKKIFCQGNEAVTLGALKANCKFYAGYPITPSTEIAELMSLYLPKNDGVFLQVEDEIGSVCAIIGGSIGGAKSLTATSGPGFSLMQEGIGFACMAEIPIVIVNVQRGGPSTGLPTSPASADVMQARWGAHGDHYIIALAPYNVEECYYLAIEAFNLSEKYRTPVILLLDEVVGHMREVMCIDESKISIIDKINNVAEQDYKPYDYNKAKDGIVHPLLPFGCGKRFHITGLSHKEDGFPTNSTEITLDMLLSHKNKIEKNLDDIVRYEEYFCDDCETLVISYGSVARSALSAVKTARAQGIKAGFLRLITLWPFNDNLIQKFNNNNIKKIIVPEMNLGQIVLEVQRNIDDRKKIIQVNRPEGLIVSPGEILEAIKC